MHPIRFAAVITLASGLGLFNPHALADENPAPDNNQALATYHEAMSYLLGRHGKPRSAEKAAELFQSLANKNWSSAQQMLGHLYYEGKGVEKNDLLAYKWLSLAARNNPGLADNLDSRRRQLQSQIPAHSLQQVDRWIAEWQPES